MRWPALRPGSWLYFAHEAFFVGLGFAIWPVGLLYPRHPFRAVAGDLWAWLLEGC